MKIIDINGSQRDCLKAEVDRKWPTFVRVDFESKNRAGYRHSEWYPAAGFLKNNPGLASLVKNAPPPPYEDLGVVSSSGKQSLTDKKKKWQTNIFAGYPLWIARGKGEGQTRTITANTLKTLALDKPWGIMPDKTSQYVISRNVHDPKVFGNTLPEAEIKKPKPRKKVILRRNDAG